MLEHFLREWVTFLQNGSPVRREPGTRSPGPYSRHWFRTRGDSKTQIFEGYSGGFSGGGRADVEK